MKHQELFPIKKNNKKPLEYKDKWENSFYVKAIITKTGKTTYVITKKLSKDCVSELPERFEVKEIPTSGQFVVRKKLPTQFTYTDVQIIEKELEKNKATNQFKIDIRGKVLSIFIKENVELSGFDIKIPQGLLLKLRGFEELMRVRIETSGNNHNYFFERYNFRGSYDDWMPIGSGKNLQDLAQKFIIHLGHESYFEIEYNI